MKRWIVWLLFLVLMLSGCNTDGPNNTTEGTQPGTTTQQPTMPPVSLYISGSALEQNTEGAVKVYSVEGGAVTGIYNLDGDIVVFACDEETTTMTRLSTQDGIVKALAQRDVVIPPIAGSAGASENKIAYFDAAQNCIVVLDGMFHEVDQIDMPEGMTGTPVLSSDLTTAFYCVDNEIRALNLTTEIPRLVCQLNVQQVQITELLFGDTVIRCIVTDADGDSYTAFYSAKNGQKLGRDDYLISIDSWDESYLVRRMDGPVGEVLVGNQSGSLKSLAMADQSNTLYILPKSNAAAELDENQNSTTIAVYELSEGKALGGVTLQGVTHAVMLTEDSSGQFVWFSAWDPDTRSVILCRWEYASGGSDETVRIGTRYTAQNPDTAGLAECEQLAADISKKYYVDILLGDQPVEPDDYSFVAEYQVPAYKKALEALDKAMARFPKDFFKVIGTSSDNPKLQINLVRAIVPNRYDVPAADDGLQYWIKQKSYMTLVVCDQIEQNFYHELCHAMSTYVNAHSSKYDYWPMYNPEGFQYDNSYAEYESHRDSPYLEDENRAFIDAYSMTFAHEDRATVFEYALMDGCEKYFTSDTMQQKLTLLCEGIRRAFGWRYYEGTFPWEQYLKESLAYVNKK